MKSGCLQSTPFGELDRAMVFAQAFTSKLAYSVKKTPKCMQVLSLLHMAD